MRLLVTLDVPNVDVMTLASLSQLKPEDFGTNEKREEILGHLQTKDSKEIADIIMRRLEGKKCKPQKRYRKFLAEVLRLDLGQDCSASGKA